MNQNKKPFFLITIDAEGDNLWNKPKIITTNNAKFLSRFQLLCDSYGLKPTYLTNYEMACSDVFKEFGHDVISNNNGEIGMHLHAWNNPPIVPLTKDDYLYQPYLIEYPPKVIKEKIKFITDLLENTFNQKMVSHRSGRWAFNDSYARSLIEHGYKIDCSVTPLRSWVKNLGDPNGDGGTDYLEYLNKSHWFVESKENKHHSLLEIPVTIIPQNNLINYLINNPILPRKWIIRKLNTFIKPAWVRPNGNNLDSMKRILLNKIKQGCDYVMLIIHSSELMPGGSPTFKTEKDIENLYCHLQDIFTIGKEFFQAGTLCDYYDYFIKKGNSN